MHGTPRSTALNLFRVLENPVLIILHPDILHDPGTFAAALDDNAETERQVPFLTEDRPPHRDCSPSPQC